ncbi:MAG: hypothetical protein AB7O59_07935 [Pirellulales bacterium]
MATVLRAVGAIVAGMLVAFALVVAVELFGAVVHPVPPDFGGTMEEMCQHVERFPQWVLAVVVPAWAGTAFASTWIAGRLGNRGCALLVGLLLLAALVFNVSMLPYPIWFKIACLIAIPCAVVFGLYLSSRRSAAALNMTQ